MRSEVMATQNARLDIIGVDGVVYESMRIQLQQGLQTWQLNISQLPPGIYLVRAPGSQNQLRFVKI